MGHVISFLNLKGGVGKTSTCHHLAGTFAQMGKRILLLDNDPQASLTQGFYGPAALGSVTAGESIAGLYDEDATPSPAALVRPTGVDGVWIIPGAPPGRGQHHTGAGMGTPGNRAPRLPRPDPEQLRPNPGGQPTEPLLVHRASLVASNYLVVPLQARTPAPKDSVRCGRPWGRCKPVRIPDSASRAIWSRCTTRGWPSTRAMTRSSASRSGPTCSPPASPREGLCGSRGGPHASQPLQAPVRRREGGSGGGRGTSGTGRFRGP